MNDKKVWLYYFNWFLEEDKSTVTLYEWNYLLLIRENSFSLHNSIDKTPIFSSDYNYYEKGNNELLFFTNNNTYKLTLNNIYIETDLFLSNKKVIKKTEEQYKKDVISELKNYKSIWVLWEEYETEVGFIDILCYNYETYKYLVLELKAKEVVYADIDQCLRYKNSLVWNDSYKKYEWIVIWPTISKEIIQYSLEKWIFCFTYKEIKSILNI